MVGRYNSVVSFVETNGLQQEANIMWGEDWEPCDDVHMIEELLGKEFPNQYLVSFLENVKEDDILVTYYNGVTPEQINATAINIIKVGQDLGYIPMFDGTFFSIEDYDDLLNAIHHKIKDLLK